MVMVRRTGARGPRAQRPRSGQVIVSFSGLDGAGKTHQIDALVAGLEPNRSVEVLWVPFKIWPESLVNRLPAEFRSRLGPRRRVLGQAPDGTAAGTGEVAGGDRVPGARPGAPGRALPSVLWLLVGTVAAVSGGLSLRRRAHASSADVLVLDRYRLDTIVKLQSWYADVPGRWLSSLVGLLAPAPDLEFLLRVDPSVAYARKPEQWSIEQLSVQARLYDELGVRSRQVVTLDAGDEPDVVAKMVAAYVRTVLNGR